jgi:ABC-type dipeptide/oligopeptide/nickel transport system permease subunit
MLVLAVLGIVVFGDGLRDALDPRAVAPVEH